jgi:Tol biopolymer transport system component
LWWTAAGDLMARVEELAGTNYYIGRVDAAEQAIIPIVDGLPIGSRLQWSHDRRFLATELVQDGAGAILILTADGAQQWQYPSEESCMFVDPRWSADDEWVTFLRRREPTGGVCEFHRVQVGSDDVQPLFDRTLADYELDTSAADHPQWISTLYRQSSEPQQFVPSLIHRETGEIIYLPNGRVAAWSKIPIRTEDSRLAIVVGVLCLGVTIVGGRFLKFWV